MKYISLIIATIISAFTMYFAFINLSNKITIISPLAQNEMLISAAVLMIIVFFCGLAAGEFLMKFYSDIKIEYLNAYRKKCEKLSVKTDCDETKLQALEAKVQTLEIALENVLKENGN